MFHIWINCLFLILALLMWKFLINFSHLMSLLIILEMIMMMNFLILVYLMNLSMIGLFSMFLFFMMNVMESCLGLGILIFLSRNVGEEYKFVL